MSYDVLMRWEDFEEAARYCRRVVYKQEDKGNETCFKIQAGRFAIELNIVYPGMLDMIKNWLVFNNAVEIKGSVSKDLFFS